MNMAGYPDYCADYRANHGADYCAVTRMSTAGVPPGERIAFWEAYNADALVGLRCSSLSETGLDASLANYMLDGMRLADISGNTHQIERSPALVRSCPKNSIFACQVVEGRAYFIQHERCEIVDAGETIVYDTRRPYIFGFPTGMRQFLIDLPADDFRLRFGVDPARLPLKLAARAGREMLLGRTLRHRLDAFVHQPTHAATAPLVLHATVLLESMLRCEMRGSAGSTPALSYLLSAKQLIAERLADPALRPQAVADALGLSLRHLNRLFATDGQSLDEYIWSKRASLALADLLDPALRGVAIGEIAFRWGFSSHAHFSRAIRARYGASPSALRAQKRDGGGAD
ncbi:Transcriptional regulator, AraC family [Burkholderia singularis]|uniref:Transcriptional regulator, AraC family n=2 Tax=Burkholderia singularis TaxID=1503053 RepID=A0A238HBM5_9BURK|nr:Transcriptional regulator, AraC family [Burkholderia singularis]